MDKTLIDKLHATGCSCVIANGADVRTFHQRGVADIFGLLHTDPAFLRGASVADKVVGKGAASLMVRGGIAELYADTISRPARDLLQAHGIPVEYGQVTDHIINRAGTDWCPIERLTYPLTDIDEMYEAISGFIALSARPQRRPV